MDLQGKRVAHKIFGEGTVKSFDGNHVEVEFAAGIKKFAYPAAFEKFLTVKDEEVNQEITGVLQEKERQKEERLAEVTGRFEPVKETAKKAPGRKSALHKTQRKDMTNVVLKCNYCDGGATEDCPGYSGLCSDDVIDYNVNVAQKVICSAEDCPCRRYIKGEISRDELDTFMEEDIPVCTESRLLRDWFVDTAVMFGDAGNEKTTAIEGAEPGSLCVLTAKDPDDQESGRYIFGVFLADDVEEHENGAGTKIFPAPGYRIMLTDEEAHKMQLWKYNRADSGENGITVWNAGLYRYTSDQTALRILSDICALKAGTDQEADAEAFLHTFEKLVK